MASKPNKKQDLYETSSIESEKASCESKRRNPREPKRMDQIAKSSTFSSSFREPKTMDRDVSSITNPQSEHKEGDTSSKTSMDSTSSQPGDYKATELSAKNSLSSDKSSMDSTSNPPEENKTPDLQCQNSMNSGKSSMDSTSNPTGECKAMDMFAKNSTSSSNTSAVENIKRDTNSSYSTDNPPEDQKPMEAATEVSMNANNNPCTRMPANPETTPMASTTTTTLNTPNTKPSDGKMGDSISSYGQGSFHSSRSDSLESSNAPFKPHTGGDGRWEAIQLANSRESPLGLSHFRLLKRLGYGDIGSVYLVELRGTNAFFAMKVMDKASLVSRNKLLRAQTEREILGLLDHPFLPTLYSYFETEKFYCLVMEFCSGGNLHSLRQKQPNKYFSEHAARFYASEVLLALEYLHMLGIVYRDLKPENVLVREEGHIMLSDFDLSLRCSVNPTLVKSSSVHVGTSGAILDNEFAVHGCIQPSNFFPRILPKKNRKSKSDFGLFAGGSLPELMAEPTHARSMSFVGTHEYLAPEIIRGEGHGSAVDWWTFGIFLYELLHGTTPFKGSGNRATLFNVVGQPLRFPDTPNVSSVARDLIRGLLVKDPQKRIAYRRGATEIKQHPFFEGVNWALVRCAMPPHVPDPVDFGLYASKEAVHTEKKVVENGASGNVATTTTTTATADNKDSSQDTAYLDFEYF